MIRFAGINWFEKTGGPLNPGRNYWTKDPDKLWVDGEGLHLTVTKKKRLFTQYDCTEIVSENKFGLGTYIFETETAIQDISPGIILGMFPWGENASPAHGEIDIEIGPDLTYWGYPKGHNVVTTVQPYTKEGHAKSFFIPPHIKTLTHRIYWRPDEVRCIVYSPEEIYVRWLYRGMVKNEDQRLHLNLWRLPRRNPQNSHVVIKDFKFIPYGGI